MRTLLCACCALAWGASPIFAADTPVKAATQPSPAAQQWEVTFNSEIRYYSWTSSRGFPATVGIANTDGKGSQIYVPAAFQLKGNVANDVKVEFLTRGGYFWSRQSTIGMTGEASGLVDTSISSTATYYGWAGLHPFASITVNAPTGKPALPGASTFSRLDSDVVDLPTFGQGWNVGPTIGANIALSASFVISLSAGYSNRGPFDREGTAPPGVLPFGTTRLDPGDVTTLYIGWVYATGSWTFQSSASYSMETRTTLNGAPFYKSGDRYSVLGAVAYAWSPSLSSKVTASFQHQKKNQVALTGIPDLVLEAFNSNSDLTNVKAEITYTQGALSFGPTGGYVYRNNNAWNPTTFNFLPAKTKWSAGLAAQYAPAATATLYLRLERLWLHENESPGNLFAGPFGVPTVTTNAWVAISGGVIKF